MGSAETSAPIHRGVQIIEQEARNLGAHIAALERELKMSNDDHSFVVHEYDTLRAENAALHTELRTVRIHLDAERKANADSTCVRDQAEAWMAVCRALGGLRGPGSTGKEIAVSMIRELQRKANRYDWLASNRCQL